MLKKIANFSLVFIALLTFLFIIYYLINAQNQKTYQEINQVKSTDHLKWSTAKKNLLIEYSDFQCPACKSFNDYITKELDNDKSITNKVSFIFRHFPLYQIHQDAFEPAYAAEAAGRQGKFFEMADLIFASQKDWENNPNQKQVFVNLAKKLELNLDQFAKDYDSQETINKVQSDLKSGENVGLDSTPTFFLNGKKLEINSFDNFKKILLNL